MINDQETQTTEVLIHEQLFTATHEGFTLHGMLSRPESLSKSAPLVVIPNSGLVHRVGTCRSSVRMARALAKSGCIVLRLDLSNLGDSPPRHDRKKMTDDARTIQELGIALDRAVQLYGQRPVIFYGLCSGSQNSFKFAVEDNRVVGLFGVDHFGFRNWSHILLHYARQVLKPGPWIRRFQRLLGKRVGPAEVEYDFGDGEFEWQYPSKETVEDGYRVLVNRGVKMHYVYTGDWRSEFNHRWQFFLMHASVNFRGLAQVQYMPNMSHILAEPDSQAYIEQQLICFTRQFV